MDMDAEVYQEIKKRVNAGVAFAEEHMTDWRLHVKPDMFDVGDSQYCFLGQWYNGKNDTQYTSAYFRARLELKPELADSDNWDADHYASSKWADAHGFTDLTLNRNLLNQVWAEKFVELGLLESANA